MTEILRRLLWLLPVLTIGAVLVFFTMGSLNSVKGTFTMPLFYNGNPASAEKEAQEALALTKKGNAEGARRFRVLGGAALPTVFEQWSGLSVKDQRNVSEALWPLRERMQPKSQPRQGLSAKGIDSDPTQIDAKVLFWKRYREEHALDLRPLSAARLVRRMTDRESRMQSADLLALDTYALPTLVERLGRITSQEDVDRARRIVRLIARVTDQNWEISEDARTGDALRVVTEVREFWDRNGAKWTSLGRIELLVARFSQTEFSAWTFRTARQIAGIDHRSTLYLIAKLGRKSVSPLLCCLLGLLLLGPLVAATLKVAELNARRFRLHRFWLRTALALGLAAMLPVLLPKGSGGILKVSLLALLVGTLLSTFTLHRELSDRLDWRTHHVLSRRPRAARVFAVGRWIVPSIPTMTPLSVAEAAAWVTCFEVAAHLHGIGPQTLEAIRSGDIDFLMYVCLGLFMLTAAAQILADALLETRNLTRGEV